MKLMKDTGSVQNWILSGNRAAPAVGKGATELHWSDRTAYEVLKVSEDLKTVTIRRYASDRIDTNNYYSEDQQHAYKELEGPEIELTFRNGAYRYPTKDIKQWTEQGEANCKKFFEENPTKSRYEPIEGDCIWKTNWNKMNIVFGYAQHYRDPHF